MTIGDVVEYDQVELGGLGEGCFEFQAAWRGLELDGASVEDAPAGLDQGMADGAPQVSLARARVADGDEVGAGFDPIPCSQRIPRTRVTPGMALKVRDIAESW